MSDGITSIVPKGPYQFLGLDDGTIVIEAADGVELCEIPPREHEEEQQAIGNLIMDALRNRDAQKAAASGLKLANDYGEPR